MGGAIRLLLAYQGTRYQGWQVQPGQRCVQSALEQAFERISGGACVRMKAAGRTDAGVHAAGQVVFFKNPSRHDPATIQKALNAVLPEDITVLFAEAAPADFDPRRAATGKWYRYLIYNEHTRPSFHQELCWHVRERLDVEAMQRAAEGLLGQHDFSAFRASGCTARHPLRVLDRIVGRPRRPWVVLDVWGRSFLKQMVRNIVGTLVEVGRGRWQPERVREILEGRDRTLAGRTAPACGLMLRRVYLSEEGYRHDLSPSTGAWALDPLDVFAGVLDDPWGMRGGGV